MMLPCLLAVQFLSLPQALAGSQVSHQAAYARSQVDFGVDFYIPSDSATDQQTADELRQVQDHGFDHVNLSSWTWTLPTAGSPLRHRVDVILSWCDTHGLGVWLLHNIQYDASNPSDLDSMVADPVSYARPYVKDWIDALKGHPCVRGVILGNEVGPGVPDDLRMTPHYRQAFVTWLQSRYSTIADLNRNWDTAYGSFGEVSAPTKTSPGWTDYHEFAQVQFGQFYGKVFDELFKPALGATLGYASKTNDDPFLYRHCPSATVQCWDDLVANYPMWAEKALTDCDPRPAFNSELHLYHDGYQYYPSIEMTRYRYFMDLLNGERMNSSFNWGDWKKPPIAAIDAATPATLAEVHRLAPVLASLAKEETMARTAVLVSEPVFDASTATIADRPVLPANLVRTAGSSGSLADSDVPPLEEAYADMASTGRPWRFILDEDLSSQAKQLDTLVVPGFERLPSASIAGLIALPKRVTVIWAGPWPTSDEYGHPLSRAALSALESRCQKLPDINAASSRLIDPLMPKSDREIVDVTYSWWSSTRGGYSFPVKYPKIEIRRAHVITGTDVVAVINNTHDPASFPIGELVKRGAAVHLSDASDNAAVDTLKPLDLKPYDIRIVLIKSGPQRPVAGTN